MTSTQDIPHQSDFSLRDREFLCSTAVRQQDQSMMLKKGIIHLGEVTIEIERVLEQEEKLDKPLPKITKRFLMDDDQSKAQLIRFSSSRDLKLTNQNGTS